MTNPAPNLARSLRKEMRRYTDWRTWLRGLGSAVIGAAGNAVTLIIVKPEVFNLNAGWTDLWHCTVASAIFSGGAYLKLHPLPDRVEVPATEPPFEQ
jgi:hypothetical protein